MKSQDSIQKPDQDEKYRYDSPKPEGLSPEESKEWDDLEHDRRLFITKGFFAEGFRTSIFGTPSKKRR